MPKAKAKRKSTAQIEDALQKRRDEAYHHVEGSLTNGTVPLYIKLIFCAPTVSTLPINVLLAVYVSSFYEKMGADLGYISLFIALARSFDVLSDPAMSYITDSCRTKHGRRRPFMLTGCIPYGILLMVLLGPDPTLGPQATAIWFGMSYISFYLLGTYCNIPYDSLGPELTDNYEDRSRLFFISGLFDGIGSLVGIMSPVMLASLLSTAPNLDSCTLDAGDTVTNKGCVTWRTDTFPVDNFTSAGGGNMSTIIRFAGNNFTTAEAAAGECAVGKAMYNSAFCYCVDSCKSVSSLESERSAFQLVGIGFGAWYILTMINCVFWIQERSQKPGGGQLPAAPPMVPSMLNTMENVAFTSLLPAWAFDAIFQGILASMLMFFVRYVVEPEFFVGTDWNGNPLDCQEGLNKDWKCNSTMVAGLSVTVLLTFAFLGTPLWLFIASKLGKRKTWLLWSFTGAITNFLFIFVGQGAVLTQIIISAVNGLPMGAKFLADAITADIIDYDEFLTGQRSEATYTMFKSFLPKICAIPASAIPLALLNAVGHVPPVNGRIQKQPGSVKTYVIVVSVIVASSFSILAFFLKFRYPLKSKEQNDLIAQGVGHHMKGEAGIDPISGTEYALAKFSAEEQEKLYLLNNFMGIDFLKGLTNNYHLATKRLYDKMVMSLVVGIAIFLLASGTAMYTVSRNWLNNRMLSFVPVMAIIFVGAGLTYVAFNSLRLKAAKGLRATTMDREFLERVINHRRSIKAIFDAARANKADPTVAPEESMDAPPMANSLYAGMMGVGDDDDEELHGRGENWEEPKDKEEEEIETYEL